MKNTNKPLSDFQKTVIYFVIYAFIGWICMVGLYRTIFKLEWANNIKFQPNLGSTEH